MEHYVKFNDIVITAVKVEREIFIAIKPICEAIGIDYERAKRTLKEHPVLSKGVSKETYPSPGGPQETLCLHLDYIGNWLILINPNQVNEASRTKLLEFQESCFQFLRNYFLGKPSENARISELKMEKKEINRQIKALPELQLLKNRISSIDAEIKRLESRQKQFAFPEE